MCGRSPGSLPECDLLHGSQLLATDCGVRLMSVISASGKAQITSCKQKNSLILKIRIEL